MKIIFTSCIRYLASHQQLQWKEIADQQPDHLFLLGDNIYMDWGVHYREPMLKPYSFFTHRIRKMYKRQWSNPNFASLVNEMVQKDGFHGIWDDHDCGWDNVKVASINSTMNKKKIAYSRKQFFKHFPLSNKNNSIHYTYDTPHVRFIFLDNRTFATSRKVKHPTLLGEKQLIALKKELDHSKEITIVSGGLTLSSGGDNFLKYPTDYQKLCKIFNEASSKVIFLSGDIHRNDFIPPEKGVKMNGIQPPFEIISSGMYGGLVNRNHRWCMLNIHDSTNITVTFHDNPKKRTSMGRECTESLMEYLQK